MTETLQHSNSPAIKMIHFLKIARLAFAGAAVTVLAVDFFFPGASSEWVAVSGAGAGAVVVALKAANIIV